MMRNIKSACFVVEKKLEGSIWPFERHARSLAMKGVNELWISYTYM